MSDAHLLPFDPEVRDLLDANGLQPFAGLLQREQILTVKLLSTVTEQDLISLDVKPIPRRQMMKVIEGLNTKQGMESEEVDDSDDDSDYTGDTDADAMAEDEEDTADEVDGESTSSDGVEDLDDECDDMEEDEVNNVVKATSAIVAICKGPQPYRSTYHPVSTFELLLTDPKPTASYLKTLIQQRTGMPRFQQCLMCSSHGNHPKSDEMRGEMRLDEAWQERNRLSKDGQGESSGVKFTVALRLRNSAELNLQIFVTNLTGELKTLRVDECDPVWLLKLKLQCHEGIPPDKQRLVYYPFGIQLDEDCKTLVDYKVHNFGNLLLHQWAEWADLPVTTWGHALDYLRYSEARIALLVSKTMASEVPKHVQTLNIFAAREMHAQTAKRFPNCTELNILCLLVGDEENPQYTVLVEDVVHRVVPFLTFFPKVKYIFVGGVPRYYLLDRYRQLYVRNFCISPDNHDSLYRYLVQSIAGMCDSGALMPYVSIEGIASSEGIFCTKGLCMCRKLSESLPFSAVIPSLSFRVYLKSCSYLYYDFQVRTFSCLSINERIGIVKRRAGGLEYLCKLTFNLEQFLSLFFREVERVHPKYFQVVYYLKKHQVQYIESLIECGCDPAVLERKRVLDRLQSYCRRQQRDDVVLGEVVVEHFVAKTTVDRLILFGFPVEEGDFRILDASTDPTWQSSKYNFLRE